MSALTTNERVRNLLVLRGHDVDAVGDNDPIGYPDATIDSLDLVELLMAVEDEFGFEIPDDEGELLRSISQIVAYVDKRGGH